MTEKCLQFRKFGVSSRLDTWIRRKIIVFVFKQSCCTYYQFVTSLRVFVIGLSRAASSSSFHHNPCFDAPNFPN